MPESPEPPFEGDWIEEGTGLPASGPQRWWRRIADGTVALTGPKARVEAEVSGYRRGADHPACPRVIEVDAGWLHIESLGPRPTDPLAVVESWPARTELKEGPLHTLIPPCVVGVRKALRSIGCRSVDRTLDRPATAEILVGPGLGGVHGAWLRTAGDRTVALRWARHAHAGRPDLDRAAAAWQLGLIADRFALLPHLLEEAVLGKDKEAAEEAREVFRALAVSDPAVVEVAVAGAPSWLDTSRWTGSMRPAEARRVMHQLSGMSVGGSVLHVRVTPPIRKGRQPPRCEPLSTRRRRLFSRWFEGIETDDEGLMSATAEPLAADFVRGLSGRVIDGTCGIGSMSIAAARAPAIETVLAVDTNMQRLQMAAHNARIYGVDIGLRHGSVLDVLWEPHDALLLDPPWGGRDYDRGGTGMADLPFPLEEVLSKTSARVRIKLPRSFRVEELPGGPWSVRAAVDRRGILKFLVAER